jgi:hypothetical protein
MEEAAEGILLLVSGFLLIINLLAVAWIRSIDNAVQGKRGEKLTDIIAGLIYGVTIAQGLLVFTFILINVYPMDYRPFRLLLVAISQLIVATSMIVAIRRIRSI